MEGERSPPSICQHPPHATTLSFADAVSVVPPSTASSPLRHLHCVAPADPAAHPPAVSSSSRHPPLRCLRHTAYVVSHPQIRPHTLRPCHLHRVIPAWMGICGIDIEDDDAVASQSAAEGPVLGEPLPRQRGSRRPEPGGWRRHRGRRGPGFERTLMSPRGG
jgi:hypothetical protein